MTTIAKRLNQFNASVLINAVYAMRSYPLMLVNTFVSPLSLLLVLTFVSHGSLIGVAVEGGLITSMVSAGTSLQADLSHLKNDFEFQDIVVSSPTSAAVYITGMALSELVYYLPSLFVFGILALLFIKATLAAAISILLAMLLMFMFSIVLGFMLSTFSSDIMENWSFSVILSTVLSTVPPVYYPITYIPLPYRYIAYLSPTTYAAEIVQNAAGYLPLGTVYIRVAWLVLGGTTLLLLAVALKKTRWREP